jgi:hypothetical protein
LLIHRYGSVASVLALGLLAGCGSAAEDESTSSLTDWLGETTHFVASGTFQGKPIDIRLMGDAATGAGAYCSRNYAPLPGNVPDAEGKYDLNKMYFAMNEVGAIVELDGQMRDISFGHWRHEPTPGTTLTVVPRTFGAPVPAGQTWVDIGIIEPGKIATSGIESAAESGTFTMKLNTNLGATEDTFVSGGGKMGVFISLSWGPQDKMTVSATVDCRSSVIAPWAPALVAP